MSIWRKRTLHYRPVLVCSMCSISSKAYSKTLCEDDQVIPYKTFRLLNVRISNSITFDRYRNIGSRDFSSYLLVFLLENVPRGLKSLLQLCTSSYIWYSFCTCFFELFHRVLSIKHMYKVIMMIKIGKNGTQVCVFCFFVFFFLLCLFVHDNILFLGQKTFIWKVTFVSVNGNKAKTK